MATGVDGVPVVTEFVDNGGAPFRVFELFGETCATAVEIGEHLISKKRHRVQKALQHALESKAKERLAKAILSKKAIVSGFYGPTWVVNLSSALKIHLLLPVKHTLQMQASITDAFEQRQNAVVEAQGWQIAFIADLHSEFTPTTSSGYVYATFSEGNGLRIGFTHCTSLMRCVRALNSNVGSPYTLVDFIWCGNAREIAALVCCHFQMHRAGEHNRQLFLLDTTKAEALFARFHAAMQEAGMSWDDPLPVHVARQALDSLPA